MPTAARSSASTAMAETTPASKRCWDSPGAKVQYPLKFSQRKGWSDGSYRFPHSGNRLPRCCAATHHKAGCEPGIDKLIEPVRNLRRGNVHHRDGGERCISWQAALHRGIRNYPNNLNRTTALNHFAANHVIRAKHFFCQ